MQLNWKDATTWTAIGAFVGGIAAACLNGTQLATAEHWGSTAATVLAGAAAAAIAFVAALRKRSS